MPRPKQYRLRKTRLRRTRAEMDFYRINLEFTQKIKHAIVRVKGLDRSRFRGKTRRYFQMHMLGDYQHSITKKMAYNIMGYSKAKTKDDWSWEKAIDECIGWVQHYVLEGTGWILFNIRSITLVEFARVVK